MKLATIIVNGKEKVAVVDQADKLFLLDELISGDVAAEGRPRSMLEIIESSQEQQTHWSNVAQAALAAGKVQPVKPEAWLPPLRKPGKIIGVALNNDAIARQIYKYFENPAFFMKSPSALIGNGQPIRIRRSYGLTHPEPELAVVVGKRLSSASEDDILDAVFGYTILNDITSVALKDEDSVHLEFSRPANIPWRRAKAPDDGDIYLTYHMRSKNTDTFGPCGPWIVTADEIPDPNVLTVDSWIDGRMIAEDSTANLRFSVQRTLAHLSRYVTLEPGDIVHMGTAVDPKREALREQDFQKYGGPVKIAISGIGTLLNPVELIDD
ncbi:fumarylacetoacetate hydrolase family protein [Paraburkholderia sp. J67]|uniref:fumarylacetoacetate hydrolase family protein n=1 Tax=Paraburkholderia sp. J67 TaxID=2805435 RepID=UPI002ABE6A6B|nr:fumarylacetoacetate hydrolase family protein [Paraburkholderia sp. J67]